MLISKRPKKTQTTRRRMREGGGMAHTRARSSAGVNAITLLLVKSRTLRVMM